MNVSSLCVRLLSSFLHFWNRPIIYFTLIQLVGVRVICNTAQKVTWRILRLRADGLGVVKYIEHTKNTAVSIFPSLRTSWQLPDYTVRFNNCKMFLKYTIKQISVSFHKSEPWCNVDAFTQQTFGEVLFHDIGLMWCNSFVVCDFSNKQIWHSERRHW